MHACYSSANTNNKFRPWTATEITFILHGAKARLCTRKQTKETPNAAKKLRARSEMPLSRWRHQRLLRANSITPCPYREQLKRPKPIVPELASYPHQHMAPNGERDPLPQNLSLNRITQGRCWAPWGDAVYQGEPQRLCQMLAPEKRVHYLPTRAWSPSELAWLRITIIPRNCCAPILLPTAESAVWTNQHAHTGLRLSLNRCTRSK